MSILLFADNAVSQLASGITNVALTATLTAGSGILFPAPGAGQYFKATFVDAATGTVFEIVHVTAVVGDTITMVRGQEGTSAHAWLAGDSFFMAPTAGTMQALVQAEQLQSGTYSKGVAGGTANALTVTVPSTRTTAADGMALTVIASAPNSSTASIVVTLGSTTLGSVALVKLNNNALAPGDIPAAGYPIELVYSATFGAWVMQNPASGAPATALVRIATGQPLPSSDIGLIWHDDYNSLMTYGSVTGNGTTYTGYASVDVGNTADCSSETAPAGWLEEDGSSLLRASYPALFARIGTLHGSADATHFNLPDRRGRFKRGWAHGQATDPDRASRTAAATGGATGDHVGSIQGDAIRNIIGSFGNIDGGTNYANGAFSGASAAQNKITSGIVASAGGLSFNASLVVPTGGDNRGANSAVMSIIKI